MTSPRFDLLAAVRAGAGNDELNASAISAVSAGFMASLDGIQELKEDGAELGVVLCIMHREMFVEMAYTMCGVVHIPEK